MTNVVLLPAMFAVAVAATAVLAWYQFSEPTAAGVIQSSNHTTADEDSMSEAVTAGQAAAVVGGEEEEQERKEPLTSNRLSSATATDSAAHLAGSASPNLNPTSSKVSDTHGGGGGGGGGGRGLLGYMDEKCGPSGAVANPTESSGPNGSQEWLNCGLSETEPDSPWVRRNAPMSRVGLEPPLTILDLRASLPHDN
jgi:hypothetical protein